MRRLVAARKRLSDTPPHTAAPWDKQVVYALKAVANGTANEGQQQRALAWIVNIAARANDVAYFPNSSRDTDFCLGMQHVGRQILTLVNMPPEQLGGEQASE